MPRKIFITLFLIALITLPLFSFAQGLVPCGNPGQPACNTCHAFQLLHNVIQFGFLFLLLPATAIAFLIGGVLMLTAGGNETQVTRAKSILWNTIIGILIAFASWVIINTILNTIAAGEFRANWYNFPGCGQGPAGTSPIDSAMDSRGSNNLSAVSLDQQTREQLLVGIVLIFQNDPWFALEIARELESNESTRNFFLNHVAAVSQRPPFSRFNMAEVGDIIFGGDSVGGGDTSTGGAVTSSGTITVGPGDIPGSGGITITASFTVDESGNITVTGSTGGSISGTISQSGNTVTISFEGIDTTISGMISPDGSITMSGTSAGQTTTVTTTPPSPPENITIAVVTLDGEEVATITIDSMGAVTTDTPAPPSDEPSVDISDPEGPGGTPSNDPSVDTSDPDGPAGAPSDSTSDSSAPDGPAGIGEI